MTPRKIRVGPINSAADKYKKEYTAARLPGSPTICHRQIPTIRGNKNISVCDNYAVGPNISFELRPHSGDVGIRFD
jgi:hypothetical protein